MVLETSRTPTANLNLSKLFAVALLALILGACSTGVKRSPDVGLQTPQFDTLGKKAGNFSVGLSDKARAEAVLAVIFDESKLRGMIREALVTNDILSPAPDPTRPTVEIMVTAIKIRSTGAAIMLGFFAGDDHINGKVIVRAPDQSVLQEFVVESSYALGGLAGGQESVRMDWLYESFAEHVAAELSGRPAQ